MGVRLSPWCCLPTPRIPSATANVRSILPSAHRCSWWARVSTTIAVSRARQSPDGDDDVVEGAGDEDEEQRRARARSGMKVGMDMPVSQPRCQGKVVANPRCLL